MSVQVAISEDFLTAILKLPRAQQKKVSHFVSKFRNDPRSSSIHYEKINDAANPDMRSVRIDQAYRGIVLHPQQGNLHILLWVDHHDEAYDWARRHQCKIHPKTGVIQLYPTELSTAAENPQCIDVGAVDDVEVSKPLFGSYSNEQLFEIGLPEECLGSIREINSVSSFEQFKHQLPNDAFEALYFIADGIPYDEVLEDYRSSKSDIDVDDYNAALAREGSKRRFILVDDEDLQQMLDAPLEKWRVFLHPTQRKIVEKNWNGPARILGGAGTGKTVVAIHRAKWLASNMPSGTNKKILFTTFTKNLAADIQQLLGRICSHAELSKIEVINIDAWVHHFLKRNDYSYKIVYPSENSDKRSGCWDVALGNIPSELGFSDHFYWEEWKLVIQEQGITDELGYIKAKRNGRGTRLNRKDRLLIWSVFEEYILQLSHHKLKEIPDAMSDCKKLIEHKEMKPMYEAVIVDEGQDMGTQAYKLIREIVSEQPNDIFVVGDGHQRIYRNKVVLGRCGINIVGRSKKLRVNYRTTEEIKKLAVSVLKGVHVDDLDNGTDKSNGYVSLMNGELPHIKSFNSFADEIDALIQRIQQLFAAGAKLMDICIVTRNKYYRTDIEVELERAEIQTYKVMANGIDNRNKDGVRLATMHRVKGLEFEDVFIACANDTLIPYGNIMSTDPVELREHDLSERALLHVAMTRAKRSLTITCHGSISRYLE